MVLWMHCCSMHTAVKLSGPFHDMHDMLCTSSHQLKDAHLLRDSHVVCRSRWQPSLRATRRFGIGAENSEISEKNLQPRM